MQNTHIKGHIQLTMDKDYYTSHGYKPMSKAQLINKVTSTLKR